MAELLKNLTERLNRVAHGKIVNVDLIKPASTLAAKAAKHGVFKRDSALVAHLEQSIKKINDRAMVPIRKEALERARNRQPLLHETHITNSGLHLYSANMLYRAYFASIAPAEEQSFDCIILAGMVMIELINNFSKNPEILRIERVLRLEASERSHSYVIVNRDAKTDLHDMQTWNNDAFLVCPWYGICLSVAEINHFNTDKPTFLEQYPLMNPVEMHVYPCVDKDNIHLFEDFIAQWPYVNDEPAKKTKPCIIL